MIKVEGGQRKPTMPGLGSSRNLRRGDPLPEDWFRTAPLPILQLRNGLRVANFAASHPYIFGDGGKLEDVRVDLGAELPPRVLTELERLVSVWREGSFDVLLVPRGTLDALGAQARGGAIGDDLRSMIVRAVGVYASGTDGIVRVCRC